MTRLQLLCRGGGGGELVGGTHTKSDGEATSEGCDADSPPNMSSALLWVA